MDARYFWRGDNLSEMSKDADVIVNSLNCTPSSRNLLDKNFFMNLKKDSYYVTFARQHTYDLAGLISALDAGVIKGAGIDCDPEPLYQVDNDFYQTVLKHPKILATPHLAGMTTQSGRNGTEIVVKNIEAFVSGNPINLLKKA